MKNNYLLLDCIFLPVIHRGRIEPQESCNTGKRNFLHSNGIENRATSKLPPNSFLPNHH